MEQLTLTAPISVTTYQVSLVLFDWDRAYIQVIVKDSAGKLVQCTYTGATATSLMVALNKANLSVQSLHRRIISQLVTDGQLPGGNVTGSPD